MGEAMSDPLTQPFRRNLEISPIIIPVGMAGQPMAVPAMPGTGVTSFKMSNPNPFWVWYRGWRGLASDMPTIDGQGHFLAPGATDICRTQMPQWIAAVASDEPGFPITDSNGAWLFAGKRTRIVMVYGSGA
jgi:hypothetical protein